MQRSAKCVSNSNKTAFNVDAPGCLESGAFAFAVSIHRKKPGVSPGHQYKPLSS